jgi:hypothetical protein
VDFYQGVVTEYLRADRAVFVNTECCIQLNPGDNPDTSGPHWYCDAIAVNFRDAVIFLCEISYSVTLQSLLQRLRQWESHWPALCEAVRRDCRLPSDWPIQPWLFVPEERTAFLKNKLAEFGSINGRTLQMPAPRVTSLESVVPWKYNPWNLQPTITKSSAKCGEGSVDSGSAT